MRTRFYTNDRKACLEGEILVLNTDGTILLSADIPLRLKPYGVPAGEIPNREFVVRDEDLAGRSWWPKADSG